MFTEKNCYHRLIRLGLLFVVFVSISIKTTKAQFHSQRVHCLKANSKWFYGSQGFDMLQTPAIPIGTPLYGQNVIESYPTINPILPEPPGIKFSNSIPVSDMETGNLRFIATKHAVYDNSFNPMPNGVFADYNMNFEKGVAIAPFIKDDNKYYYFTINYINELGFTYSVIDMNLNNGLGDIADNLKNIVLKGFEPSGSIPEIIDVIPGNNCNMWLIIADNSDNLMEQKLYAFNINEWGIDTIPKISTFTKKAKSEWFWDYYFAPNRDVLAYINYRNYNGENWEPGIEIKFLNFNIESGYFAQSQIPEIKLLENKLSPLKPPMDVHIQFTPDNKYLLIYDNNIEQDTIKILKYSIRDANSGFNKDTMKMYLKYHSFNPNTISTFEQPVVYFKTFDNTIYMNEPSSYLTPDPFQPELMMVKRIPIVKQAEILPFSGNVFDEFKVGNKVEISGRFSLNSYINYPYLPTDTIPGYAADTIYCIEPETRFPTITMNAKNGYSDYVWNDGTLGPTKTINNPGKYWVFYKGTCASMVDTFNYEVRKPEQILGPDTNVCEQRFPFTLKPLQAESYLWSDMNTQGERLIPEPGTYWVKYVRNGCTLMDTIIVNSRYCPCDVKLPNAFTPNGDGLNDYFKPQIALGCVPNKYSFSIYNRFGQRLYTSFNEFDQGWNGTFKGRPCDLGVYFYEIRFESPHYEFINFYQSGEINLIR